MKTQAWGWLGAAVLAAGLNSSYHNGGLQWVHGIADQVQHNTNAVLALATGRADDFLAEARMLRLDHDADVASKNEKSRCPLASAWAHGQRSFEASQAESDQFQALSDREQAKLARFEANRARIEAQVRAKLARIQVAQNRFRFADGNFEFADDFTPVVAPQIRCERLRVATPHIPRVHVKIPRIEVPGVVVDVENSGTGPI